MGWSLYIAWSNRELIPARGIAFDGPGKLVKRS